MNSRQIATRMIILRENPDLGYRDTRDLLMEYGTDGITAGKLAEGRPGTPGE